MVCEVSVEYLGHLMDHFKSKVGDSRKRGTEEMSMLVDWLQTNYHQLDQLTRFRNYLTLITPLVN